MIINPKFNPKRLYKHTALKNISQLYIQMELHTAYMHNIPHPFHVCTQIPRTIFIMRLYRGSPQIVLEGSDTQSMSKDRRHSNSPLVGLQMIIYTGTDLHKREVCRINQQLDS